MAALTPHRRLRTSPAFAPALLAILAVVAAHPLAARPLAAQDYARTTTGTRILEAPNGVSIRVLVEAANLGGPEVEMGEITFPVGSGATPPGESSPRAHRHGAVEIFYVLEGTLDHIVNGESHVIGAGGVAVVRPGDTVVHRVVGDTPVRALVIWAPGGEVARIAPAFRERPIGPGGDVGGRP
jgi:mannose-6-phosphate isomerase-like protein (cupin superfamily)